MPDDGKRYEAPFGVELPATGEGAQPELVFISKERLQIIGEDWIRGAADLVMGFYLRRRLVEIAASSSNLVCATEYRELYTDRLPVRVHGVIIGHSDLARIYGREA